MIVFQIPTHPVILSNLGWCFFVENSVETFKDIAKVEHLWKKRETILENLLHNKLFDFCQGKKNKTSLWKKKQRFFGLLGRVVFSSKWGKQKTNKRGQKFFFFLSRQQYCCARQSNIFLFHNCPKSTSLWQLPLVEKKSSSFFLLKKLRSYKKSVIRDL